MSSFDRIDHQALLHKLVTFPTLRRAIKGWLKAGVMDEGELFPTDESTPQGGVLTRHQQSSKSVAPACWRSGSALILNTTFTSR